MPSTYGATPIQPNQNVQTKTGKYVGIGLLCACVLTIGVSMKEDASTFTGMSTKSENKIYTEFSDDGDFTSKRDSFLGMKGVNGCPNGTEPIYDHTECRTQAANLGFSYYEKYTASSDNSVVCNYCSGCDKLNTPNIIEDGGSTVRVDQSHASRAYWVCKAITAKPTAAPTGTLVSWVHTANAAIPGHNHVPYASGTVDECKAACVARTTCKSFDYDNKSNRCTLSDSTAGENGVRLRTDYTGNPYDHYALTRGGGGSGSSSSSGSCSGTIGC